MALIMKLNSLSVLLLLFYVVNRAYTFNILGIYPYQGKSHFLVFKVYLQELARRGHNVTVISHFPEKEALPNYQDISLAGSVEAIEDNLFAEKSYKTLIYTSMYLMSSGIENCKVMLQNKQVQHLIKQKPKFDVILVEQFNSDCALGVAYKLGGPVVAMSSHILMPYHYKRLGIPYNPSYVPFHFLEGGTKPSLYQRIERVIFDLYFRALYHFINQRSNQATLAEYFDDIPPLEDLARDIKFVLLYHNFILTGSRLFPSNIIEVGGYHVSEAKPLTGSLKKFIDEADHGVIYISFGSVIKSSTLPADKVKAILDTINEMPQRFIWKWEENTIIADKNKLYMSAWLPQVDILGHPNILGFFSHAGMGGTTEAIHFGIPVVAMPFIGDQPANAATIEESGLGVQIDLADLTKESLANAFKKILDPKFRQNVKDLSKAWHDRPMPPLDTAVYWTEFVARHPQFTFRTAAADTPFYQYMQLDVTLIFIGVVVIIFIVSKTIRNSCKRNGAKTTKRKKSKKQ